MNLSFGDRRPSRLALLLALSLASCATMSDQGKGKKADPDADIVRITIVGTSDLHGWIEPHENEHPGDEPVLGGIGTFAGYMNILREQRPDGVVLLDAGDLFQGTLVANLTEGASVIKGYNGLHYDASAVGNHEFDYGPVGEASVPRTPGEDPVGALKTRMQEANFPFLVGNIFQKDTGEGVNWPNTARSIIIKRQGVKIGIIGLSTPTTPSVTLGQNVAALDFRALAPTTLELAKDLRTRGAKIVIVTMHAGGSCPKGTDPHDITGCTSGEVFPFLRELPPGTVDAVVAGHTHQYIANFINGVPVIESKSYGEAFGVIELAYNTRTEKVDATRDHVWAPTPICRLVYQDTNNCKSGTGPLVSPTFLNERVVPDTTVEELIAPDIKLVSARKIEKLGPRLDFPFTRSREAESDLGDLVADVMRGVVPDAAVALTNSGGLRADIDAGSVTYGRVYSALPFENRLAVIRLTGAQIVALISRSFDGDHGVAQISGIRVQAIGPEDKPCVPGGSRVVSATLESGGPIVPTQMYTLVTNDFVAGGGDGYDAVLKNVDASQIKIRYDLPPIREEVVAYLRFHEDMTRPMKPAKPRITLVKPKCAAPTATGTP